jgi:hypothetical protein
MGINVSDGANKVWGFSRQFTQRSYSTYHYSDTVPKIVGSNPAEAVGFFGRKNPQHAFLRRESKAVCPMSQICGM